MGFARILGWCMLGLAVLSAPTASAHHAIDHVSIGECSPITVVVDLTSFPPVKVSVDLSCLPP